MTTLHQLSADIRNLERHSQKEKSVAADTLQLLGTLCKCVEIQQEQINALIVSNAVLLGHIQDLQKSQVHPEIMANLFQRFVDLEVRMKAIESNARGWDRAAYEASCLANGIIPD